MEVIKYNPKLHEPYIKAWLHMHNRPMSLGEDMPRMGYLAVDKLPIASIFVRRMEGNMGMIDGLMTNPHVESQKRNDAIEFLVSHSIGESKKCGMTKLIGFSVDKGTIERSKTHGFSVLPDQMIALDLEG